MGSVGDGGDNAMAERFFAILEGELLARQPFRTHLKVRGEVSSWPYGLLPARRLPLTPLEGGTTTG